MYALLALHTIDVTGTNRINCDYRLTTRYVELYKG